MTGFLAVLAGGKPILPLSVVASDVSRTGRGPSPSGTVTTVALPNTTITGGVGPYTQEWTLVSGDTPTVSSATALNPTWTDTVEAFTFYASVWRCTVTDALSATASTEITIELNWVETT